MGDGIYYLVIFKSPNQSSLLLKILRNKGYNVTVISAPCSLTNGCSRAIKFKEEDLESIKQEIESNNISISGLYKRTIRTYKAIYNKIL